MLKRYGSLLFYAYFGLFFLITLGLSTYFNAVRSTPPQPVPYPHVKHLQAGLQCLNCHQYADKGKYAGLPPLSFCMSCHQSVGTNLPGIKTLTQYWKSKKPVEWNRLHRLPDFVYFSHKRHVMARTKNYPDGVPCQSCHGQVQDMPYPMRKSRSLTMGFCVGCHRDNNAPLDCYTCHK